MKKALVVIDVQKGFMNASTTSLPAKIAKLVSLGRGYDCVIFTKFINHKKSNYVRILNWRRMQHSPDTDLHPALAQLAISNVVIKKSTYSAFGAPAFQKILRKRRITELDLTGIDIDACVLATAYDAFDLGYKVTVLTKYCGSQGGQVFSQAAQHIIARNIRKRTTQ